MKALILAAGYATRLYPLTENLPKALLPMGSSTMLDILLEAMIKIPELDGIHLVTNHRFADQFHTWAEEKKEQYGSLTPVIWDDGTSDNATRLGAIGDIQFVLEKSGIEDDLLIAACDNLFSFDLRDLCREFHETGHDTICAQPMDDYETLKRFAVALTDENGTVTDLEEKPAEPKSDLAVYAVYLYRKDTLPLFRQYLEDGNSPDSPGHFPGWLYSRKPVHAFRFTGEAVDIGTVDSYREAKEKYEKNKK